MKHTSLQIKQSAEKFDNHCENNKLVFEEGIFTFFFFFSYS